MSPISKIILFAMLVVPVYPAMAQATRISPAQQQDRREGDDGQNGKRRVRVPEPHLSALLLVDLAAVGIVGLFIRRSRLKRTGAPR